MNNYDYLYGANSWGNKLTDSWSGVKAGIGKSQNILAIRGGTEGYGILRAVVYYE
jgi:hypothetical protein